MFYVTFPHLLLVLEFWNVRSFKVNLGSSIFKGPKSRLLLDLEVWDIKTTYKKTYPANLLMMSNLNFDPWALLQGQTGVNHLKSA